MPLRDIVAATSTAALTAALLLRVGVGTASAATPEAACKNGGFSTYVNPATNQPFRNQGHCVAYVAKGGQLQPVARPALEFTNVEPVTVGYEGTYPYTYYLQLSGFAPNTTVLLTYQFPTYTTTETVIVDGSGNYLRDYQNQGYCEQPATITASSGGNEYRFTPQPAYCHTIGF
jgi:hypothetical protein